MSESNNGWLPQGYETPTATGKYTKFKEGETRLRILSSPIMFWEVWKDNKPTRYPFNMTQEKPDKSAKHVWAFKSFNYTENQMEVTCIHQVSIKTAIESLAKDKDYGNPFGYDIKINRKGKDLNDTEYTVIPTPPKVVSDEVKKAFAETPIDLNKLLTDESPFGESKAEKVPEFVQEVKKETVNENPF